MKKKKTYIWSHSKKITCSEAISDCNEKSFQTSNHLSIIALTIIVWVNIKDNILINFLKFWSNIPSKVCIRVVMVGTIGCPRFPNKHKVKTRSGVDQISICSILLFGWTTPSASVRYPVKAKCYIANTAYIHRLLV